MVSSLSLQSPSASSTGQLSLSQLQSILNGTMENPSDLLGPRTVQVDGRTATNVRAFLPDFEQAWLLEQGAAVARPMRKIHPQGIFEGYLQASPVVPAGSAANNTNNATAYRLRAAKSDGKITEMHDPYATTSILTDFDKHLFNSGRHWQIYNRLGAQLRTIDGVDGVNFAVWAPNAQSVQVVGDFNCWDGRSHAMFKHIPAGIWEIFVPSIGEGMKYKFRIKSCDGETIDKTDPYGFYAELPPRTASIVASLDNYQWNDSEWIADRVAKNQLEQPISIYEVHLGSWKKKEGGIHGWMNYRELAHELVAYCQKMNFTHLELMPITEHPYSGSWGYQTTGYYSVTSRFGTPEDFMYFVDYCHQNQIGVILDWVPAHFPKDAHGLRRFDGSALFEHADPRQGEHPDWGTMIFNYDRTEVSNFLIANALFWMDKYHIDGMRVDAVASMLYLDYSRNHDEWIPNQFGGRENLGAIEMLKSFNEQSHSLFPGVLTIAEESTAWPGVSRPTYDNGLGFSLKWNMGWMNDTLRYIRNEPVHRKFHQNELTFSLVYAFTENFTLPLSHDEVVHGKGSLIAQMAGDLWQKFANLRLLYAFMWAHPGKKLLFMGCEIAQWHEWNYDSELPWDLLKWDTHRGVQSLVSDLNGLIKREPAMYELDFEGEGFEWIDCLDAENTLLTFMRKSRTEDDFIVVACNFTPIVRRYRFGLPKAGFYREIFNSDSSNYGGSNVGNGSGVQADEGMAFHSRPHSMEITLPPLATVMFKL